MKKNYIYLAIGAAILIYLLKNKNKPSIDTTTVTTMRNELPNTLDVVLNPESGAVQIVPSPATIMPYIKTLEIPNDMNVMTCSNCCNTMSGVKTMPYTC